MAAKPNILIIWGDDIGWFNISANNNGIMGYRTPNIDRIAKEGANFTDWYRSAELHGWARGLHHRAIAHSHRPHQGWPAGADIGLNLGPDDHRRSEASRVCDRPVRQEPPW